MKKHLKKVIVLTVVSVMLAGCGAEKVEQTGVDENIKVETEKKVNVAEDFKKIVANGVGIEAIKTFIDENISYADRETADQMVYKLIELQKKEMKKEMDYLYGENTSNIQNEITKAYEKNQSKFDKGSSFIGKTKYVLVENMEDKKIAENIKKIFDKGYGLYSAEGSYYPVSDYKIMKENYSENVTDMTGEYMDIMVNELDESTTVEEYLSISPTKLKDRALKYEEFIKNYPDAQVVEDVKMMYMLCIWKLVNPNIFDGMVDNDFRVVSELNKAYESILKDKAHPVTVEAVKGITEFIKSKNGVLGSMDNMDELYAVSHKLHDAAGEKIKELYLGKK